MATHSDMVLAIDPGTTRSAWLYLEGGGPLDLPWVPREHGIGDNATVLADLRLVGCNAPTVVVEQVESYGMPVGREVFETVRWAGRFEEACHPARVVLLPRRAVKLHLCASPRANDASIRQALLDKYGGKAEAIGRKATPGPLYGIHADEWSALALALTHVETRPTR